MDKKKYITRYDDSLDPQDLSLIESIPSPWRRTFIKHFYEKLQEKKMSKKDVCNTINKTPNKMLDTQYRLTPSALTQYTNYKNLTNLRPFPVDALIAISDVLDVSIDYLLGIESSEHHDITDIHNATGLTTNSILTIKSNSNIQDFINALLESSTLDSLILQSKQLFLSKYVSTDILSAYSKTLREIIFSAFNKYAEQTSPFDNSPDIFETYLEKELLKQISVIDKDFIINHVSKDRYNQIIELSKTNNHTLSSAFLYDTVYCVYDILSYANNSDYYRSKLLNLFSDFLDEYITKKSSKLKESLHSKFNSPL